MRTFIGKLLSSTLLWCCWSFNFTQFVILKNLSILDLALSRVKDYAGTEKRSVSKHSCFERITLPWTETRQVFKHQMSFVLSRCLFSLTENVTAEVPKPMTYPKMAPTTHVMGHTYVERKKTPISTAQRSVDTSRLVSRVT